MEVLLLFQHAEIPRTGRKAEDLGIVFLKLLLFPKANRMLLNLQERVRNLEIATVSSF